MKRTSLPTITEQINEKALTPSQKKFNRLIKKLHRQKKALQDWIAALDEAIQQIAQEFTPKEIAFRAQQMALLQHADKTYGEINLTVLQRKKLQRFIIYSAEALLNAQPDDTIKALHDQHAPQPYDAKCRERSTQMQADLEEMLNIDLGDDFDMYSEEALAKFTDELNRTAEKIKPRKKTKRQLAKEAEEAQTEKAMSQSVRAVFRQLAQVLHPDRETDKKEQQRKSELMQKANIAYKNQDLLTLLSLQLEIEQIHQANIDGIAEERLRHYNKVLTKQCVNLNDEIDAIKQQLDFQFQLPCAFLKKPRDVGQLLAEKQYHLDAALERINIDIVRYQKLSAFKRFINSIRLSQYPI
jgi:hypothetical protein